MEARCVLKMDRITKRFYSVTALDGVSLELYEGEVLGLCGENGAGKSTLMKVLSGSYPSGSYEGTLFMDEKPRTFHAPDDAERTGIQMIYQEISLTRDLTVAENMFMGNLPRRKFKPFVNWNRTRELCREALQTVGLDVSPDEVVRRLSTSQMQLLCIAKALYRNPKILVLDEPTSALTEAEAENLLSIIGGLREKKISCIYISHKLSEVCTIADRITVLRDGKSITTLKRSEFNLEALIHHMVGREITNMYPKIRVEPGEERLRVEHMTVPSHIAGRSLVEDVSFSVRRGEILGIGGLIGSGRSELVNAIFGAIPRSSGKVYVDGKLVRPTVNDAIHHKIGLVTEDRKLTGFVGTMNIRENTTLASFPKIYRNGFIQRKDEARYASDYFDSLGVKAPGIETGIVTLSGGNQQKVVLAKWLLSDVKVLILDEPTRGIDVGAKVEIYNTMNRLAAQGLSILMISSETTELLAMCDRFIVLSGGKITGEFSAGEITQQAYMRAAAGLQ